LAVFRQGHSHLAIVVEDPEKIVKEAEAAIKLIKNSYYDKILETIP
jgi:hypothetical protein